MATKITSNSASKRPVKKRSGGFMGWLKAIVIKIFLWFIGLSLLSVVFFKFVPVPFTPLMLIRAIENKVAGKPVYFSHDWEP